jgi:hypothetical protein
MRATLRILWVITVTWGLPCGLAVGQTVETPPATAADDADDLLQRIIEQWDRRAAQFRSVRYQLRGETWHAAGSSIPPDDPDFEPGEIPETGYPVEETTTPLALDWLIDFERGMFRRHSEDVSFNVRSRAFRPFVRIEVFDGERPVGHWPREANTSPHFTPGRSYADVIFWGPGERTAMWIDLPVFYAHGLVSVHPKDWRSGGLAAASPQRGADERMIDGDACLELQVKHNRSTLRFYVAERLDWLPRRVEHENLRGGLSNRVDIDYEQTPEGWFPRSWRVIDFLGDPEESKNRILKEHRLTVVQRELNLATRPEEFRIALQPGMVVNRRDLPEFTKQRVDNEGKLVPFSGFVRQEAAPLRWRWLVLINGIAGILFLVVLWRKRAAAGATQNRGDRSASE